MCSSLLLPVTATIDNVVDLLVKVLPGVTVETVRPGGGADDSHIPELLLEAAVLETGSDTSAPVSSEPDSSASTAANSLQGKTICPDGASSHWYDSVPGGKVNDKS